MKERNDFEEATKELVKLARWADKPGRLCDPVHARLAHGEALCTSLQLDLRTTRHIKTDETERDPVSGNLRPKFRFERVKVADYDLHMGLRISLRQFLTAIVAAMKREASPAYPEAWRVFVDWEYRMATMGWESALEGADAAALIAHVNRCYFELAADGVIAAHNEEVVNG